MNSKYILFLIVLIFSACQINEVVDPDNPTLSGVLSNASKPQLRVLVTGLEARHRGYYTNATQMFGSFAREVAPFFASDPRFGNDWYGTVTYPDFFASNGTYLTPYLAVKQANVLIGSVNNTSSVTAEERSGYLGFAKTIKAYQLIWPLMQQYQNGIRIDVENPLNPGPIVSYNEALTYIRTLLNEAKTDLQAAGTSFDFELTMGFSTPAEFLKVNRAIAARVALYDGDYSGALTALSESFMDRDVTSGTSYKMNIGPVHVYGNSPDVENPLYYVRNAPTNTILIVHPAMIDDMLSGDARGNKFYQRTNIVTYSPIGGIQGEYQDNRWDTNTDPIPFIRNEELILIYAEAQARKATPDFTEAINAINIVRNTWNLSDYIDVTPTVDEILEEILFQRRYSLWAEAGHRWIDLRRTGKLDAAHVDLTYDRGDPPSSTTLITQVARRASETNWDDSN
jgi:starch-binding outer membrane protein, SusD/RagB family